MTLPEKMNEDDAGLRQPTLHPRMPFRNRPLETERLSLNSPLALELVLFQAT